MLTCTLGHQIHQFSLIVYRSLDIPKSISFLVRLLLTSCWCHDYVISKSSQCHHHVMSKSLPHHHHVTLTSLSTTSLPCLLGSSVCWAHFPSFTWLYLHYRFIGTNLDLNCWSIYQYWSSNHQSRWLLFYIELSLFVKLRPNTSIDPGCSSFGRSYPLVVQSHQDPDI